MMEYESMKCLNERSDKVMEFHEERRRGAGSHPNNKSRAFDDRCFADAILGANGVRRRVSPQGNSPQLPNSDFAKNMSNGNDPLSTATMRWEEADCSRQEN
jgi:hypothetical protein